MQTFLVNSTYTNSRAVLRPILYPNSPIGAGQYQITVYYDAYPPVVTTYPTLETAYAYIATIKP